MRLTLLVPVALLAACSSSGPTATGPAGPVDTAPSAAATSGPELRISGYAFPALSVAPGAQIALIDLDGEPHTVTAKDGAFASRSFDSAHPGTLVAPSKPGSYTYTCTVHPSMRGTLVVR